jgi:hypothetical protein
MPSSRFTVKKKIKKTTQKNHIYIFYVSKCLKIYLLNAQLNFLFKSCNYFIFYLLHNTICRRYTIKRLMHDLCYHPSTDISHRLRLGLIWKRSCINIYTIIGGIAGNNYLVLFYNMLIVAECYSTIAFNNKIIIRITLLLALHRYTNPVYFRVFCSALV